MRRLCLWFPLWPIQRYRSAQPEVSRRPLALYESTPRGERLSACSPQAARYGLSPGQSLSEAETLVGRGAGRFAGRVLLLPAEPEADREALLRWALLCQREFSPLTSIEEGDRPECLLLDTQGCAHLFGGEEGLLRAVVRFFRSQELRLQAVLADTIGAAWALAHYGGRKVLLVPPGETESGLRNLPPAALRLPAESLPLLQELGIETCGQLLSFPRADLASRFGPQVVQRIRQALGIEPEQPPPVREREPLFVEWSAEDGIRDHQVIEQIASGLLEELLEKCRVAGGGLLQCVATFQAPGGRSESFSVELIRPTEDHRHLLNLLTLQWEVRPLKDIHQIRLEARRIGRPPMTSGNLFADSRAGDDSAAFQRLMERLSSRLGKQSVLQAQPCPDAQPERGISYHAWLEGVPASGAKQMSSDSRTPGWWERPLTFEAPHRLPVISVFPEGPPQQVAWRGLNRSIRRWWGPERIETGWWRGPRIRRDYYRVELETGEWLWLFREQPSGVWRLQGVFD